MKYLVRIVACLAALCLLVGCGKAGNGGGSSVTSSKEGNTVSKPAGESKPDSVAKDSSDGNVRVYPVPDGAPKSADFTVTANGETVGVYSAPVSLEYSTTDSFGYFDLLKGTANVTVKPAFGFSSVAVLPESAGVKTEVKNGEISFSLDTPRDLTLVFDGDYHGKVLQVFVSPPETDVPKKGDPGVIYVAPGYYTGKNYKLISGDTLYIAGGAYIEGGTVSAAGSNIRVCGRGVLSPNEPQGMYFGSCSNSTLEGIILNKKQKGWSGQVQNCDGITVDRYRVVSPVYYSTDGLNITTSKNVTYRNCYFRTGDDCVSIKGGNLEKPSDNPVDNVLLENCTFWSDGNNAVAIGSETYTPYMRNITVRNCEILYVHDDTDNRGALAIICLHGTDISNILFENINIGPCGHLLSIFYTAKIFDIPGDLSLPGEIHGVTYRNISQKGGSNVKQIRFTGFAGFGNDAKMLSDVTVENVTVEGKKVTADYGHFITNEYTRNIVYK